MMGIQQVLDQVTTYLKGIWIKKRYVLISSWLICPIGWMGVASMPDQYESSARLYVDTNSLLRPLLRGLAFNTNPENQVKMVADTLLSRPTLEKIAREADLDIKAKTKGEFDKILGSLKANLSLRTTRERNIYTISYESGNAQLSQKIVQITLNEFVENSLGSSRRNGDTAEEFLNKQIAEYEVALLEAEQRLAEFKRSRMERAPSTADAYFTNLQNQRDQLKQAQLRLEELESQLVSAKAQLACEEPVFGLVEPETGVQSSGVSTQYDSRIAALESRLDELLIQYTDQHPDVVKTRGLIEHLRSERNDLLGKMSQVAKDTGSYNSFGGLNQNPVYQQLKLNVARIESEIASTKVRVDNFQASVNELQDKINLVPVIEAEFQALNRDYGIKKSRYEELLNRRESAQLSRKAEATTDDVQFRVIDPPLLPSKPSGPPRLLLYTLVLFVGFGAGLALAFIISQLNAVVFSTRQITEQFNIPVLGAVSHFDAPRMQRAHKRNVMIFTVTSSMLVMAYIAIMVLELSYGYTPFELIGRFI
ncbi:XrtA system polysaccharide chain length determinant [Pseudobowmanella zhangzhouensis]|uniref:XrtA system polysaccharide chain length determinant n=1 Tax=Pseudobowmanella zhangzhouensis TaxID=1537679 RepID=A0ABW1XG63_9ALTE